MKQVTAHPDRGRRALLSARPIKIAAVLGAGLLLCAVGVSGIPAQVGSPAGAVPVEELGLRRAALLDSLGEGIAIVRSADLRSIEGDYPQDSDYRENNDFFYLTGLEAPGGWLALASFADRRVVRLFLPPRDPRQEQWTGPRLGPGDEARQLTGIDDVRSSADVRDDLAALLREGGATVPVHATFRGSPRSCPRRGAGSAACTPILAELGVTPDEVRNLDDTMAALRLVKDDDEIRRLRRSIDITAAAHREAMRTLEPGVHEYELEAVIEYTFRRHGAERVAFPGIIGSGPNTTILHYDRNRRMMSEGDLVVVDIGAEYGYYAADVTRTYPVSGRFSDRQRAIYQLVLDAQQAAIDAVRPGVTVAELTAMARGYIDRHSGALCGGSSCGRYFVHGLSHWLGMDVHDVGSYSTRLLPGMVLTIEPGIYIAAEELGVRIEDDVLVTPTGYELLSAGAPRSPDEIEQFIAEARKAKAAARTGAGTARR